MRSEIERLLRNLLLPVLAVMAIVSAPSAAAAQTPIRVAVTGVEVEAGSTSSVPINIEGAEGIVAMHVEITYDPAMLRWDGLENGELLSSNSLVEVNSDDPGTVVIGIVTLEPIRGTGVLLNPSFSILGAEGTNTTVGLQNVSGWDDNGFDVLMVTEDGSLTIGGGGYLLIILLIAAVVVLAGLAWWLRGRRSQKGGVEPAQVAAGQVYASAGQMQPGAAVAAGLPPSALGTVVFVSQPVTLVDNQQNPIGQLQPGRSYTVVGENQGWLAITDVAGNTGWTPASAVNGQPG